MSSQNKSDRYSPKIGFTGKIPDKADFISRFLSPNFISFWDEWIDSGMNVSKRKLGECWLSAFLVAPVWHFSICPGLLGDLGWLGVVIPSVDTVGRYYPLTVAIPFHFDRHHRPETEAIYDHLESIAIAALDEGIRIEDLEELCRSQEFNQSEPLDVPVSFKKTVSSISQWTFKLDSKSSVTRLSLSGNGADTFLSVGTCFWSSGSPFLQAAVHYFDALPGADFFISMLKDGDHRIEDSLCFNHPIQREFEANNLSLLSSHQNAPLTWHSTARTDPGLRPINQDSILQLPDRGLWAVADGMGGHLHGERASQFVLDSLCQLPKSRLLETHLGLLINSLSSANQELQLISQRELRGELTGTTFVGLIMEGSRAYVVWVGDSRIYRYRRGELELLTVDHSFITNRGRTSLSRAVGGTTQLNVDTRLISVESNDLFLLCSDGLYRSVTEQEMACLLSNGNSEQRADALLNLALEREASDNVSLILLYSNSQPESSE